MFCPIFVPVLLSLSNLIWSLYHTRFAIVTNILLLTVPCHEVKSVLWKEHQRRRRIINLTKVQRLIPFLCPNFVSSFIYGWRMMEDDEFGQSSKINCFLGFPAPLASQTNFYFVIRATDPANPSSTLQKHNICQTKMRKLQKRVHTCARCVRITHTPSFPDTHWHLQYLRFARGPTESHPCGNCYWTIKPKTMCNLHAASNKQHMEKKQE